eukprot:7389332-Prymnesium_polylepis.1
MASPGSQSRRCLKWRTKLSSSFVPVWWHGIGSRDHSARDGSTRQTGRMSLPALKSFPCGFMLCTSKLMMRPRSSPGRTEKQNH